MATYPDTPNDVKKLVTERLRGDNVGPPIYEQAWPGEWLYSGYARCYRKDETLAEAYWQGLLEAYQTAVASEGGTRIDRLAYANDLLSRMERAGATIPYSLFPPLAKQLLALIEQDDELSCLGFMALLLSHLADKELAYAFWQRVYQELPSPSRPCDVLQKTKILYALNGLFRTGRRLQTNFTPELEHLKLWAKQGSWPELPAALTGLEKELDIRKALMRMTLIHAAPPPRRSSKERWTTLPQSEKEAA